MSADADPYTGVAVYDSTETEGNKGWATIGGTSVAAPIIASVFALAGGAHEVAYPARTLYENELQTPGALHDVTLGSNGECRKPFEKSTGTSGCTVAEQARNCSAAAICLAGPGYDGPSGVGTPDGLAAFQPPGFVEGASEGVEPTGSGAAGGGAAAGETRPPTGTSSPGAAQQTVASPPAPSAPTKPVLSALSLTRGAIAALARRRPRLSKLGFAFALSAPARVRVTISRRTLVHRHARWKLVSAPTTIFGARGAQSRRIAAAATLPPGVYRLTLVPEHGAARSISFRVG